jgi:PKD repeat protein
VKLRSCNRFGCDSIVQQINSNLYQNSKALCNINTNRSIDGRGVTFVSLNQINNSSGMSIYRYFQCPEARLSSHKPDTLRITTSVNSDVWAMIDFNSNGVIDTNEIVMTSVNKINHQSIVNIPSTAIKGIPLRMRVASFYPNSNLNNVACLNYNRMQYEEYNIIITDSTVSPIARFNSTIIDNCNRIIQFRDTSYNSPLSWQWDFGDNTNSTLQHPTHSYHTAGTYQVKLITSNITGSDTITRQLFVPVGQTIDSIIASSCSTYLTPSGKTLTTSGIYLDTLTSSMSCDSIFHIDLQISLIDTTLFQSGLMIRSNEPNAQYQWLDCSNGYNQIVGETLDSIVVLQNGIYGVEITKGACVDTSVCLNVTWVGIEEDNSDQLLELYPIPATDKLFIRLHQPLAKNESIELLNIYSLSGKEIATYKSFSAKEIILDVSRFPKGVYVIKLKVDQRLFVRKFIIS